jgi:membrane peptidoglycan carboxypeptidase
MGKMPTAVINMEDLAFPYHHGYLEDAFQNSLTDNVARGKFARGGSTITQQAAKNLWLTRDKTIGRKVAELFLAQALEGCYSKDQIMEVYLNIVEFAPDVYGAKDGAKHWFGKGPGDLDDVEAFWLAGVLPRPRKVGPPTKESMAATEKLMESMAKQGRIPGFVGSGEDVDMAGWGTE